MTLDRLVVARGAAAGLLLATPAALANVILADQEPKPRAWLNLTLVVLLAGFFVAGLLAGHEARGDAARHGALAAALAFVPVQVIGVLGRLDRGADVVPGQIVFLALLAAVTGTLGALLGSRGRADTPNP